MPIDEPPSLPLGFRYDAIAPGPLQLVDDDVPSTKVCPSCGQAVVAAARACKRCGHGFEAVAARSPASA